MNNHQKALGLEYFTVGYNSLEALFSILFGAMAASVALIGFGLDSVVESLAAIVLIWRLYDHHKMSEEEIEAKEKKALKFVAVTFFVLGAYVGFESLSSLWYGEQPDISVPGIIIATLSLLIMPVLAAKKRRIGELINSKALIADSKETLACAWLSVGVVVRASTVAIALQKYHPSQSRQTIFGVSDEKMINEMYYVAIQAEELLLHT